MADETAKPRIDRTTWIFIAVGIVILVVPAAYRVIPVGYAPSSIEYPATCRCVKPEEKKWWQLWR